MDLDNLTKASSRSIHPHSRTHFRAELDSYLCPIRPFRCAREGDPLSHIISRPGYSRWRRTSSCSVPRSMGSHFIPHTGAPCVCIRHGSARSRVTKTIVQSLHRPVVDSVVQEVRNAHKTVLQGMPFPEIPVISISGALIPSPFFTSEVIARLEQDECCVAHIHPSECATVSSAMKALVSGFVDKHVTIPQVKRKPTASLASYDIGILIAWYEAHGAYPFDPF
jgi:hypothetical protein